MSTDTTRPEIDRARGSADPGNATRAGSAPAVPAPSGRVPSGRVPSGPVPTNPVPSDAVTTAGGPDPRRWLILGVLALTQLMIVLDATIVSIALPQIQTRFGITDGNRQWVVTAYGLAFGGLLLLGGRIADFWGRKRALVLGVLGFAVASAIGGLAVNSGMLYGSRALQGMFAALLAPAVLSVLSTTFTDPRERASAFALYGAIGAGGAALGLVLGGVLTEYLSWRWCLLVNLPLSAIAAIGAIRWVRPSRVAGHGRYDLPGAALVTAGLAGLVYGFTRASEPGHGWSTGPTIAVLAVSVALLAAFVGWEARSSHPLMPLRIPADPVRAGALLASLVVAAGFIGSTLFLTFYFQVVEGYSPVRAGLASLPLSGAIAVSATVASKAMPVLGPRILAIGGALVSAVGLLWTARLDVAGSFLTAVLPGQVVLGLGLGFLFVPLSLTALHNVAPADAGVTSALLNATNQIGGSLGTALLNTIATSATAAAVVSVTGGAPGVPDAAALVTGYQDAFVWAAVLLAVGAVVAGLMVRVSRTEVSAPGTESVPVA